ncbi:hypothetical protein XdyCFBP7245_21035 [Xanthomonas dyei]|uniref:Uncharacterized protein n=1 Tax=Xanthomonas dyei TaxID=743699 RepID=A0A2S7BX57_9XANT|nr:hypothetical protein XdyCFBP7245_21035 [Xanthomonas dyei]
MQQPGGIRLSMPCFACGQRGDARDFMLGRCRRVGLSIACLRPDDGMLQQTFAAAASRVAQLFQ